MPGCLRCLTSESDLGPCPADGTCARCGHRWVRPPFFAVSGATGVGKSTVCAGLPALGFVALDDDLLWRQEYLESREAVGGFYRSWLRFGVFVGQSGRPLVLGTAVIPARWESLVERSYVSEIHSSRSSPPERAPHASPRPRSRRCLRSPLRRLPRVQPVAARERSGDEPADDAARHDRRDARRDHCRRGRMGPQSSLRE